MQAIFQLLLHNEKWWYVIRMAPHTKPLFHSLLPESRQPMDTDTTSDQRDNNRTHPSKEEGDGSWVAAHLLHNDEGAHEEIGNLRDADADNVDEANPYLATLEYGEATNNIDPSVDLCIELGSGNMIDLDKDTNLFLTIDIDPFLVIDSCVDHNS
jgi:hypothetical protein